jgi:diguanylate cyclase (GGDEF)-like protein
VDRDDAVVDPEKGRIDSDFLARFNYLDKTGALDDLSLLRSENRELDALINDAATLFALKDVEEMVGFVISRLLERFIPTRLAFAIETGREGRLRQYCYRNLKQSEEFFPDSYYPRLKDFFKETSRPATFEEVENRLGPRAFGEDFRGLDPKILFPMRGIGGPFGIMLLGGKIVGDEYSDVERMYLDRLSRFLSIGIQNRLHHESSITDAKTGLYNHHHFMQRLDQEIARVARHSARAGIIMLDVDHFKIFNDTWGHLAGDEVLNAMALVVKKAIRSEDVAARFGGEEFCVLVIECDEASLFEVGERIRHSIEGLQVPFKAELLSVTASLGCCFIDASSGIDGAGYLERADRALYVSKASGRNRSTIYRTSLLDRARSLVLRMDVDRPLE